MSQNEFIIIRSKLRCPPPRPPPLGISTRPSPLGQVCVPIPTVQSACPDPHCVGLQALIPTGQVSDPTMQVCIPIPIARSTFKLVGVGRARPEPHQVGLHAHPRLVDLLAHPLWKVCKPIPTWQVCLPTPYGRSVSPFPLGRSVSVTLIDYFQVPLPQQQWCCGV